MTSAFASRAAIGLVQVLTAALVLALMPAQAAAQASNFDAGGNPQIGPLGVNPRIAWRSEYDDNVFRSAARPMADMISILGASTDARARVRRIGLTANGTADYVHYSRLHSERGANADAGLRADLLFNRFAPYMSASYSNSRQRGSQEIDTRPRSQQSTFAVGGIIHLGVKTAIDLSVKRSRTNYEDNATIDGVNLSDALNRESNQASISIRREVTTLTRLTVSGEMNRDQFSVSPYRDADNIRLTSGFESDGVIRGHARAGVQVRTPHDPSIAKVRGFFLSVGTAATVRDRLEIGLNADRDLMPSYRSQIAYYDSYGYEGTISYALRRSLRLSALFGRRHIDYRSGIGLPSATDLAGVDIQTRYGSGIGYQVGQSMSIDFSGTYVERTSPLLSRGFDGLNLRAGITHAF